VVKSGEEVEEVRRAERRQEVEGEKRREDRH
jgi:hypothetical protein